MFLGISSSVCIASLLAHLNFSALAEWTHTLPGRRTLPLLPSSIPNHKKLFLVEIIKLLVREWFKDFSEIIWPNEYAH